MKRVAKSKTSALLENRLITQLVFTSLTQYSNGQTAKLTLSHQTNVKEYTKRKIKPINFTILDFYQTTNIIMENSLKAKI